MPGVVGGQSSHANQGKQLQSPNQLPKRKSVMHIPGLTKWEAPCPPNAWSQPWKRCCGPKYNFESNSGETSLAYFPRKISKNYLQVLFWREDIITTQGGNTGHRSCRRWRNTEFIQWTNWWANENFEHWSNDSTRFQSFGFWIHDTSQEPAVLSGSFWIKVPEPWLTGFGHSKAHHPPEWDTLFFLHAGRLQGQESPCAWGVTTTPTWHGDNLIQTPGTPSVLPCSIHPSKAPGTDGGGRGWRDQHNCATTSRLWCRG